MRPANHHPIAWKASALALALALMCGSCAFHSGTGSATLPATDAAAPPETAPSTTEWELKSPDPYTHVVNIWMAHKGNSDIIDSPDAPFETQMAKRYGSAADFRNLARPALADYIAATSGSTQNIPDDDAPAKNERSVDSIFAQLERAGKTWKTYADAMEAPCQLKPRGTYVVSHNPAAYYLPVRSSCASNDLPLGTPTSGALADAVHTGLPNYSLVIPDLINDTHDAPVATGDQWLQQWVTTIMSGKDYRSGDTAIIISWDESDPNEAIQPEIVISPTTTGIVALPTLDHYDRLAAQEEIFGLPLLGEARTRSGVYRSAFHL